MDNFNINEWTSIIFPILYLLFSIISCIWLAAAFRKKILTTKSLVVWVFINVLSLTLSSYLVIIAFIHAFNSDFPYEKLNFLDYIGKQLFGIQKNSWVILLGVILIFVLIVICIHIAVKFNAQNQKINDLNRNLAILKGKIAIETEDLEFNTAELSADELKLLLEEQFIKEKLKSKYKAKIEKVSIDSDVTFDTKTLMNIRGYKNNKTQETSTSHTKKRRGK